MGSFSIWHWLIVLVIVLLIFGTKKLRNLGSDLGGAVKGFKDGMKGDEAAAKKAADNPLFKEITESQKKFAERAVKWDLDTNVSRRMAYNHYFAKKS